MNNFDWKDLQIFIPHDIHVKLGMTIVIALLFWIIHKGVYFVFIKNLKDVKKFYKMKKLSSRIIFLMALFIISLNWFEGIESLSTFIGLLSAGIAISLRELLINIAAWVFIVFKKPFEVGDRIQINDHSGDVIDLRVFQFTLMEIGNWVDSDQSTGRIIHISNSTIFSAALANYSKGFEYIWNEIPVMVTFESDWKKAKSILLEIATHDSEKLSRKARQKVQKATEKFMIFYTKLTPIVYTSVKDFGILLTIRYLCKPQQRRCTEDKMWEDILTQFSQHKDIDFAYPTHRFYNNLTEGKQAKPPE